MLEYRRFCYLDVPKTGSTFIRKVLQRNVVERHLNRQKHRAPRLAYRQRKFYFASVRDPLDSYGSLYRYGCAGKGRLRARLAEVAPHLIETYDGTQAGFEAWLTTVLSPGTPPRQLGIPSGLARWECGLIGTRHLALTMPFPVRHMTWGDRQKTYRRWSLPRALVRQESLRQDLADLITGPLRSHFAAPEDVARRVLRNARPLNRTRKLGAEYAGALPDQLRDQLRRREWLHYDVLGYGDNGTAGGSPPA